MTKRSYIRVLSYISYRTDKALQSLRNVLTMLIRIFQKALFQARTEKSTI